MRIGTWNLAGRWDARHERLLRQQDCDVWLLTEVSERLVLAGYMLHTTAACIAPRRRWAAVLSRMPLLAHPDPHPASALAGVGELMFCSSILPWRSCGDQFPWHGVGHAENTRVTLDKLLSALPLGDRVWGGDWNHALSGSEQAGSKAGRAHLLSAVAALNLQVPTAVLPHRLPGLLTIDHIAVPAATTVLGADRVEACADGRRLSDHDMYVVEVM